MGERAIIRTKDENGLCIYTHWHGYREDIEAILEQCKKKGHVPPDKDSRYGWAALCYEACNMFGVGLGTIGIERFKPNCDYFLDHGIYVIEGWDIIDRIL